MSKLLPGQLDVSKMKTSELEFIVTRLKVGALQRRVSAELRRRKKTHVNKKRSRSRSNPSRSRGVLIYGRVIKVFAQKTAGPFKGQRFVHTFKPGAVMYGLPDGSLRITHP